MKQSRPLHHAFTRGAFTRGAFTREATGASSKASGRELGGERLGVIAPGHLAHHRGLRRLQAQDQFLPLLVSATLLTTITLVLIAYLTVRADVLASQQQEVTRDARIAQQMLAGPGGAFALKDGQLVAFAATGQETPTALAAQLAHVRDLTGERVALYSVQARGLVAVASAGLGTVGEPADAAAVAAVVGDCGPMAPRDCYHSFAGTIYSQGGAYTAAYTPLFDPAGALVGALGVAQPQSAVLAPAAQFTIVLLFVGLLVTLVVLAIGVWTCNLIAGEVLDALHLRLNHLATIAAELERAARQQVAAARRQERMARQITEGARDIDALVNTMQQGHLSMHDSATGVWAEMSQPGTAPDPAAAMRFARQAVVMAARVGVAAEDARARCNAVVRLMNQVIAEGHVLSGHGHETERRAEELRGVVEQVERALGEPLGAGPSAPSGAPGGSRLASLSSLPGFAPAVASQEPGWLARQWQMARLYTRVLARALIERAHDLAGHRTPLHQGKADVASGGDAPERRSLAEPSPNTRPALGIVRPDELVPPISQADGVWNGTSRGGGLAGLPDLPGFLRPPEHRPPEHRPPEHPRWRDLGEGDGPGRGENDTRPREL